MAMESIKIGYLRAVLSATGSLSSVATDPDKN
jgi:hypothetical protein